MQLFSDFKEKWKDNYFKSMVLFHALYFLIFIFTTIFIYDYSLKKYLSFRFFSSDVFEWFSVSLFSYLFYFCVFKKEILNKKKLLWLLLGLSYLFIVAVIKKLHIDEIMMEYYEGDYELRVSDYFRVWGTYLGFSSLLLVVFWVFDNLQLVIEGHFFETITKFKEARMMVLRQQFNPHFLFNALNSIYSMSLNNNPMTSDTILKLSGMMRYLTDNSVVSHVKLSHEIKFIKEYIALEKIRFGQQANITFDVKGNIDNVFIEPLMLVTLVENAFKHGFYTNDSSSFVNINALVDEKILSFEVENSIQKKQFFQGEDRKGTGLENLRTRLKLSYPKMFKLDLEEQEKKYIAKLEIKLK